MSDFSGKWAYSTNEETYHGMEDSPEDALAEANGVGDGGDPVIFVAQCLPFIPGSAISADSVLDTLRDAASEHAGEHADGWLDGLEKEAVEELDQVLGAVIDMWVIKHKLEPHFYAVDDKPARRYERQEDETYKWVNEPQPIQV